MVKTSWLRCERKVLTATVQTQGKYPLSVHCYFFIYQTSLHFSKFSLFFTFFSQNISSVRIELFFFNPSLYTVSVHLTFIIEGIDLTSRLILQNVKCQKIVKQHLTEVWRKESGFQISEHLRCHPYVKVTYSQACKGMGVEYPGTLSEVIT